MNTPIQIFKWPRLADVLAGRDQYEMLMIIDIAIQHPEFLYWHEANKSNLVLNEPVHKKIEKERVPDRILMSALVEFPEWVGPKRLRQRVERRFENCVVRFYNKKREIELPGGGMITKMESPNLRITEVPD